MKAGETEEKPVEVRRLASATEMSTAPEDKENSAPEVRTVQDESAEKLAGDKDAQIPCPAVLGLSKIRTREGPKTNIRRFSDFGESGFYVGELAELGSHDNVDGTAGRTAGRHGRGKMIYDGGSTYEGGFVDDKFHGEGVYRWHDGDEQEGSWLRGKRHGRSVFRAADGVVEYSMYEHGIATGEGVTWSADRKRAHKMVDGRKRQEISPLMAEKLAKAKFNLPVPELSAVVQPQAAPTPPSESIGLIRRLFSSREVGSDGTLYFKDYGEWGFYVGDVDEKGHRQGMGKMTYDSGNDYEGGFVDDKFEGEWGVYHWLDAEEYEGAWKEGERHGIGVFRSVDGSVEYSKYEKGSNVGVGVWWSADRKTAHKMMDGKKKDEISLGVAEMLARERFDLPVPEAAKPFAAAPTMSFNKKASFLGSFFSNSKLDSNGKKLFKDCGEWGFFEGDVDAKGDRQGDGKMTYDSGNYYEGGFMDDKFHGDRGVYHWSDGDEYEGSWKEGERHGIGIFRSADGTVEYSKYEKGSHVGEGVVWSADRQMVHKMMAGEQSDEISLDMAEKLAMEKFDLPVPEPTKPLVSAPTISSSKNAGFFRSFFSNRKVGPGGEKFFKDYGEWGLYEGDVDAEGDRQGQGKMTYDSGNYYEGGFANDKFDGDKSLYHWVDGDEYEGAWKEGERHGIGIFRLADGTVEYSKYEKGSHVGEGLMWSFDRQIAHKMSAGKQKGEITLGMAEKLAREKFDLPVPEPAKPLVAALTVSSSKNVGFLERLFSNRKSSPDGRILFKDCGEWGSYEGDLDADGNREGNGKMTYNSGNYYEGGFHSDKFHGDKGVYHWSDGDEYEGPWRNGERHGVGVFRLADGSVEYSKYEKGSNFGEGVWWGADRNTARKMLDGKKQGEISPGVAEKIARDKFDLPVPKPSKVVTGLTNAPTMLSNESVGFLGSLFPNKSVGPDGNVLFKDYGDWGSYDGVLDTKGNRQGEGKMTYGSGNYYEGGFLDNKFHGHKGLYRWTDGDEYEGSWKEGERDGVGIFRTADGIVEYSVYEKGVAKGDGLWWSADRKSAHKMIDGKKGMELLIDEAKSLAEEKFGLPIPEASAKVSSVPAMVQGRKSALGHLFNSEKEGDVGPEGKMRFNDYNDWGSYNGEFDTTGKSRHGKGEMAYDSGAYYKGSFVDNKFHGDLGIYRWADGDEYEGAWSEGERSGIGIFRMANGVVEYSIYEAGQSKGEGLTWSADRKTAHKMVGGNKKVKISLALAEAFAKEKFDLPIPEPFVTASSQSSSNSWFSGRTVFQLKGNSAEPSIDKGPRFEDYGDMGTYDGEVVNGLREGEGKMIYDSGNLYEGDFSNGKFDGNRGLYRWSDGTEYEGSWKKGSFNGIGIYRTPGVGVDYSIYKDGYAVGVGIFWNNDCTKAHYTLDGVKMTQASLANAEKLAKDKFGLPAPNSKPHLGITSSLGWIFQRQKVGADRRPLFKDYGDWGSYEGDLNTSGERYGQGKMTYHSGNYYEGGFVDNKFHCDKGVYHWSDGDEYEGSWEDGERQGVGIFRSADGSVDYSKYEKGSHVGEGVWWSADRKKANKMVDGAKKYEMLIEEAELFAKDKFGLPVPEITEFSSKKMPVPKSPSENIDFLTKVFSSRKVGSDGTLYFKDYGDWGFYEGDVDETGKRQGQGKMTYDSGNYYKGGFAHDKFHGHAGVYHWSDGEEYEGSWKDGERHGKGKFKNVGDATVEYSKYENGQAKGEGVLLSEDGKIAYKLINGEKKAEMLVSEAKSWLKENKFA